MAEYNYKICQWFNMFEKITFLLSFELLNYSGFGFGV